MSSLDYKNTIANTVAAGKLARSSPSNKWVFGANGLYTLQSDIALSYDGSGQKLGARIEDQSTNLHTRSTDLSHSDWGATTPFASVNAKASCMSGETAYEFVGDGVTAFPSRLQTESVTLNFPMTPSVIIEQSTTNPPPVSTIAFYDGSVPTTVAQLDYTWATDGVVTSGSGSIKKARVEQLGTGPNSGKLVRLSITDSCPATSASGSLIIYPNGSAANSYRSILHHAQSEFSFFETSPIKTEGSTVTRNADILSVPLASFPFDTSEGSIVMSCMNLGDPGTVSALYRAWAYISDGSNSYLLANAEGLNSDLRAYAVSVGVIQADSVFDTGVTEAGETRLVFSWRANDFRATSSNGGTGTDAAGSVPAGLLTLYVGGIGAAQYCANSYVRWLKHVPRYIVSGDQVTETTL